MRKILSLLLFAALGFFFLQPTLELSHAKQHVIKKKIKKKKKRTKVIIKSSRNINSPQEGDLLKLEGMVKDLNEQ
ncbi:MAG: hypothetical protein ACK4SM_00410 [Aquificaceae bacterium]